MLINRFREGFTLVEISFSMLFIGVLSISVVLIISNTVAAYQRGMTLSRVNNAGTDLSDDMRVAIQSSSARSLTSTCSAAIFRNGADGNTSDSLPEAEIEKCEEDNAYKYIYVIQTENINLNGRTEEDVPIYGAFCTGSFSYVWNSGYFESDNASFDSKTNNAWAKITYLNKEDGKTVLTYNNDNNGYFRLVKIQDEERAVCMAMVDKSGSKYEGISNIVDLSVMRNGTIKGEIVNLLPDDGGNDLALYDLYVARPASSLDNNNLFYSVSLILGTVTGGVDIMAKGNSCAAPNDLVAGNYNYCAINKFNFAIQVNGG